MTVATAPPRCLGPTPIFIEVGDLVLADGLKLRVRKGYCTRYGYAVIWHGKLTDGKRRIWGFRSGRILVTATVLKNGDHEVTGIISGGTIKVPTVVLASSPSEFKELRLRDGATITFIPPTPDKLEQLTRR
jgi:hypothetical protein